MSDEGKCSKHGNALLDGPCGRCDGDGYTEADIEAMHDPLEWHSDGSCYSCGGSGVWKKSYCIDCEHNNEDDQ